MAKACGSVLHFACSDPDGQRGEEKIRLILEAARRCRLDMSQLLANGQAFSTRAEKDGEWVDESDRSTTPIYCLLDNKTATVESFRILCQAWPQIVHLRDTRKGHEYIGTVLIYLVSFVELHGRPVEENIALTKILLEAAEKTALGAKGLVSALDTIEEGIDSATHYCYGDVNEEHTALHTATTVLKNPEPFITLFLQAWPEALLHCHDLSDFPQCTAPLHNVTEHLSHSAILKDDDHCYVSRSRESILKSIEAFMCGSTLEALAFALLYSDCVGDLGFHLVQTALQHLPRRDSSQWRLRMDSVTKALIQRKDNSRRTLLHYIASNDAAVNEGEFREREIDIVADIHVEPSDEEWAALQEEREKMHARNRGYVVEICQWILDIDASAALVRDAEGMNPFHYALSEGRRWQNGLQSLAKLVPVWPHSRERKTGLYPFMLAASPEFVQDGSVDTIYELLRFDASIMMNIVQGVTMESAS